MKSEVREVSARRVAPRDGALSLDGRRRGHYRAAEPKKSSTRRDSAGGGDKGEWVPWVGGRREKERERGQCEDVAARSGTPSTDGTTCKASNDRLLTPSTFLSQGCLFLVEMSLNALFEKNSQNFTQPI